MPSSLCAQSKMVNGLLSTICHRPNNPVVAATCLIPLLKSVVQPTCSSSLHAACAMDRSSDKGNLERNAGPCSAEEGIHLPKGKCCSVAHIQRQFFSQPETKSEGEGLEGHSDPRGMTIVPSHDKGGTNCLILSPPNLLKFCFGADSYAKHLRQGLKLNLSCRTKFSDGIGLDVDTPCDLRAISVRPSQTLTQNYLEKIGIHSRLNQLFW